MATTATRETWDGGYAYMVRRMERERPDEMALLLWRFDLQDTPGDERGPFWRGMWEATGDALAAHPAE